MIINDKYEIRLGAIAHDEHTQSQIVEDLRDLGSIKFRHIDPVYLLIDRKTGQFIMSNKDFDALIEYTNHVYYIYVNDPMNPEIVMVTDERLELHETDTARCFGAYGQYADDKEGNHHKVTAVETARKLALGLGAHFIDAIGTDIDIRDLVITQSASDPVDYVYDKQTIVQNNSTPNHSVRTPQERAHHTLLNEINTVNHEVLNIELFS